VAPESVNFESFGKPSGFYNRQLATLKLISEAQANAEDLDTKRRVGKIPHFDEMVGFFAESKTQPKDRSTLVHGDYKIDNLVFHKTEPRVIGILE
jgi:aminoglycoside phosphotransferase (APT) family kinase protein